MNLSTIKSKLLFTGAVIGIVMLTIAGVIIPPITSKLASDVLKNSANFTVELLAANLTLGMQTASLDDGAAIEQTLSILKSSSANNLIQSVDVFDPDLKWIKGLDSKEKKSIKSVAQTQIIENKRNLHFVIPLKDGAGGITGFTEIVFSKKQMLDRVNALTVLLWILGITISAGCIIVFLFISNSITRPIDKIIAILSNGDLSGTMNIKAEGEIGRLLSTFNTHTSKLKNVFSSIAGNIATLSSASETLTTMSINFASNAEKTTTQADNVAVSTEQASVNVMNISGSAAGMSESVQSVAVSIEEMSTSLNEVSINCQKESQSAANASNKTKSTREIMERLADSAREIGEFVEVVNQIAAQTNLLALNATIEAARAGASGKGFAVVATEVKELANQTAIATKEISKQIKGMQGNTDNAVNAMNEISSIIEEVNMTSQTIVSAVEEQSSTLCEIAKITSVASSSATEIAKNVDESAQGLNEITINISEVKKAAADTALNVNQVKNSAAQLSKLAKDLLEITNQFKVE